MVKGSMPALITPFKGGAVDETAYQSFIEWQIAEGTDGVITGGTTGESVTLHPEEQFRVTKLCVEAVAGRIPVMAGSGSNSSDVSTVVGTPAVTRVQGHHRHVWSSFPVPARTR